MATIKTCLVSAFRVTAVINPEESYFAESIQTTLLNGSYWDLIFRQELFDLLDGQHLIVNNVAAKPPLPE